MGKGTPERSRRHCKAADRWGSYDASGVAVGYLCGRCKDVYTAGYSYMGEDEVVQKKKSDATFARNFLHSRDILERKVRAEFRLSEISKRTVQGTRLVRSYTAHTKASYEQLFKVTPQALGHKPVEICDELGDKYQAYLVEDPSARRLEVFVESTSQYAEFHQTQKSSLHEAQASQVYKKLTADPKHQWIRKVGKAKTLHEVEQLALLAQAAMENNGEDSDDSGVSGGDGDDAGGVVAEDADMFQHAFGEEGEHGPQGPVAGVNQAAASATAADAPMAAAGQPPQLGAPAVSRAGSAPSPSMAHSARAAHSIASPPRLAASSMVSGMGGSSEKAGPAKTVSEHLARLGLTAILSGSKVGVERRWAAKFVEDNHETDIECELLRTHLLAVDAALSVRGGACIKMPRHVLAEHLRVLQGHNVDFPSSVKRDLLEGRFLCWQSNAQRFVPDEVDALLDLVVPWPPTMEEGVEPEQFDPMLPKMSAIEGSVAEHSKDLRNTMVRRVLLPALRSGSEGAAGVKTLCERSIHRLETADDIDEGFGEVVFDLLRIFRLVLSLILGSLVQAASFRDIEWLRSEAGSRSTDRVGVLVAALVMQTAFYLERFEALEKYSASTALQKPHIDGALSRLASASGLVEVAAAATTALGVYQNIEGKVLPAIAEGMKATIEGALEGLATDQINAPESGGRVAGETMVALMSAAQEALGFSPARQAMLEAALSAMQAEAHNSKVQDLSHRAIAAKSEFDGCSAISPDLLASLTTSLQECKGLRADAASASLKSLAESLLASLFVATPADVIEKGGVIHMLPLMMSWVSELKLADASDPVSFTKAVDLMTHVHNVARHAMDMRASLSDPAAFITDDMVTTVRASFEKSLESFEALVVESGRLKLDVWGNIQGMVKSVLSDSLSGQLAVVEGRLKATYEAELKSIRLGGKGDADHWADGLSSEASFSELFRRAQETLLKRKGSDTNKVVCKVKVDAERWLEVQAVHGQPVSLADRPLWFKDLVQGIMDGSACVFAGIMLLHMKGSHTNTIRLKSVIKAQVKLAEAEFLGVAGGVFHLLPPPLRKACDEACRSVFAWPADL